ncbi:GntR family transcriptional regulator [Puniceibacterium sediminis]|uniref:Transcriptional regulator, GntR family n=1 Tax=Puniceibacterium sediminis TaxID=1608407 RepID=A0A238Y8C2_9RHOB|nr:GntR family transcriptional regulator [Puniceibacterium sediminis]SNR66854.1 transcriptional regulator, GntR family [Puniceibacterium sediminis]
MRDHVKSSLPEGGKARRVYLLLRDEILNSVYLAGGLLPGEQRLAQQFDVSRVTIRRALDALEADGMIDRRAGSGTTVLPQKEAGTIAADMTMLIPQLVELGQHSARLLSFSYGPAPEVVARDMGLTPQARVQRAVRVRIADGSPFSHLTTYVPENIAANYSESDLAATPLFRLLERSGVQVEAAHQTVSAALATPEVAEALEVSVGSALLSLKRIVRDTNGRGVEYLSALYRPDRFQLEMTLSRVGEGGARHWEPVIGDKGDKA